MRGKTVHGAGFSAISTGYGHSLNLHGVSSILTTDRAPAFISYLSLPIIMAKKLAVLFGIVFVLVGVLGFIPNPIVGATALFVTDALHNIVHLLIGVVLLIVAMSAPEKSSLWLKIFGVIYLLLAVLGFILNPSGGALLGLVMMNTADHWLHVVLGVVLLIAGIVSNKPGMAVGSGSSM
jgi:hypothetical protein